MRLFISILVTAVFALTTTAFSTNVYAQNSVNDMATTTLAFNTNSDNNNNNNNNTSFNNEMGVEAPLIMQSTVTCPKCAHTETITMKKDASPYAYKCSACQSTVKRADKTCCVFCSYGTHACPASQMYNAEIEKAEQAYQKRNMAD